jgi:Family of unknown function (DUF5670)
LLLVPRCVQRRALCDLPAAPRRLKMLWTIVAILLILWLLGFSFHIAGSLVHLLLIGALVVVVLNLLSRRRTA